ncbi:DUF6705 family protein [Chryseobacterium sp. AG844]|uniref:DUF6705 family protein n=1 Tax=Chryseobacterium sp. AG844 TaxID=2183998 RepID=UPI000D91E6EC|nr:DUF6705 family protein [Chryseobacterium sp. AG844]PWW27522.1 hypothetical protein DEU40_10621 [Chryseobacterium sp. AG844]
MKNILSIICFIVFTSCMGQTVSLETMAQCEPANCPAATYIKDVNNLLNKYVGTWKGSLNGKNYEFNFIKKENFGFSDNLKRDRLIGRLKITNSNGIVEYDSFNKQDNETDFFGNNFQKDLKVYLMRFSGNKINCIDYGYTYMWIKPETPNQIGINFHPDNDIVKQDCTNFKTTLPDNQIIHLTRQ